MEKLDILAYRFNSAAARSGGFGKAAFSELKPPPAFSSALSPDGTRLCFWGRDGARIYDYESWEQLTEIVSRPVLSVLWVSRNELIIGDADKLEYIRLNNAGVGERKLICLTGVAKAGFEKNGKGIFALSEASPGAAEGTWYSTDGTAPWTRANPPQLREASLVSQSYRVYLERGYGFFENVPMVRNISSVGTRALLSREDISFTRPEQPGASLSVRIPVSETPGLFSHGDRGKREVALCFDLYDDDAGLSLTLDALSRFGIRATFFLNGEFIRRHPAAAKEIAEAGHETVSMFYAPINLSDVRYLIDKDYITRGLARNEDEFFKATGKELGLLWHPPYYAVSAGIVHAAGEAGYKTIGRDIDPGDWITRDDAKRITMELPYAADMIDNIMDAKQGGSIIPIRLGLLPGGRKDYLFNSLEVLLEALSRDVCAVVTVSDLINHSGRY
jgi:peptidoglycan/xylan/chitin deacetylase (PgdA/CDA1 family)